MNSRIALIELDRQLGDRTRFDFLDPLRMVESLKRAGDVDLNAQLTLPIETE